MLTDLAKQLYAEYAAHLALYTQNRCHAPLWDDLLWYQQAAWEDMALKALEICSPKHTDTAQSE